MYFKRLRDFREDNDLSQVQVAKYLNIDQRVYSTYETGKRTMPIALLMDLARFYDTSIDYLVGLTDDTRPYKRANIDE